MAKVGISKLHYAVMDSAHEDAPTANPQYGTIKAPSVGLINVDLSVENNTVSLYADNMVWETENSQSNINFSGSIADFPMDAQADLLGHTYSAGGSGSNPTLIKKSSDTAPYVALGFEFLQSNGKKLCVWLYKGKFAEPNMAGQTKGENTEYQPYDFSATFAALKGTGDNTGRWLYMEEFDADDSTDTFYTSIPLAT